MGLRSARLLSGCGEPYRETQQGRLYVASIICGTVFLLMFAIALVLWIVVKLWAAIAL